jgi:hypothetical protein
MTAGALGHSPFVPKPGERDVGPDRRAHGSISNERSFEIVQAARRVGSGEWWLAR